jgi:hypothetical protein
MKLSTLDKIVKRNGICGDRTFNKFLKRNNYKMLFCFGFSEGEMLCEIFKPNAMGYPTNNDGVNIYRTILDGNRNSQFSYIFNEGSKHLYDINVGKCELTRTCEICDDKIVIFERVYYAE